MRIVGNINTPQQAPDQGNLLTSFAKGAIEPLAKYGSYVGEAGAQGLRMLASPAMRKSVMGKELTPEEADKLAQMKPTFFMKEEELGSDPSQIAKTGIKRTAGAAAYSVPIGRTLPAIAGTGAVSGALSGFAHSKEGEELAGTAGGALAGGILGGGMGTVGRGLSALSGKIAPPAREAGKKGAEEVSKLAARTFANIWQIPKNKSTQGLNPVRTAQDWLRMKIYPKSLDEMVEISSQVTGRDGLLAKVVREALDLMPTEVNISGATTAARTALKGKLGFGRKETDEVVRSVMGMLPSGKKIDYVNALDAFDVERQLQAQSVLYKNAWERNRNPKDKVLADAFNSAYRSIVDTLDNELKKVSIMETIKTPERIATLRAISPTLADDFVNATTIAELRSLQAPFVQAMQMASLTSDQAQRIFNQEIQRSAKQQVGAIGGAIVGGPLGLLGGYAAGKTLGPALSAMEESVSTPLTIGTARLFQQGLPNPAPLIAAPFDIASSAMLSPFVQRPTTVGAGAMGQKATEGLR